MESFRLTKGRGPWDWPSWCYVPIAAGFAVATDGKAIEKMSLMDRMEGAEYGSCISALATWRVTQGIYRFHPDVLDAVWETPLDGNIPVEILFHFPEWCIYVETPGKKAAEHGDLHGFFALMEYDYNDKHPELRLLLDVSDNPDLFPIPLHLSKRTLEENIKSVVVEAQKVFAETADPRYANMAPQDDDDQMIARQKELLTPMVSLLLYICSLNAEFRDATGSGRRPARARPTKTKGELRYFPADKPTIWETGWRTGAAIQKAKEERQRTEGLPKGIHASPVPHIRKAHWHSFWTGPRKNPDQQKIAIKWLPPIPVNIDEDSKHVPTVHEVR